MTAVGRPAYTPPTAPPVEVPTVAPALQTLPHVPVPIPVVDWEGHWHTLAGAWGCVLAGAGAAWAGVTMGDLPLLPCAAGAAIHALFWLFRVHVESRAFGAALQDRAAVLRQNAAREEAERALWATQIAALRDGYAAQRDLARAFGAKHYRAGAPERENESAATIHPTAEERALAAYRAELADLRAVIEAHAAPPPPAAPEPEWARVMPPAEQVTQQLDPARGLLAAAYRNGPAWKLVERAARHDTIAAGPMTTSKFRLMTDPQWRKATGALSKAGVLVQPAANQGYQLAADLDGDEVTDLHTRVLDRLFDAGVGAADLPSDLPGQSPA